ncbi:MAG TPA: class I SAM-dependent methyltransferase [Acidimicrobiales bacterium]
MSEHEHGSHPTPDEAGWDERYRSSARIWSGRPNPQLVAEISGMAPGLALDVGCGEGADALWLAQAGWDVVGADISGVALERAAEHARQADPATAARIRWRHADLLAHPPEPDGFDLVSAQFMQLPPDLRTRLFTALAASVMVGGTLLVVGHDPSDMESGVHRPRMPEVFYTAAEVAALLDDSWTVAVNEARPRAAATPEGSEATVHDAVLRATRRGTTGPTS